MCAQKKKSSKIWRVLLVAGIACLLFAFGWTMNIVNEARPSIGSLGGQGDWFWVILQVVIMTGLIWLLGTVLLIFGLWGCVVQEK